MQCNFDGMRAKKVYELEDARLQRYLCDASVQANITLKSLEISENLQLPSPQIPLSMKSPDLMQQGKQGVSNDETSYNKTKKTSQNLIERAMTPPPRLQNNNRSSIGTDGSIWGGGAYSDAVLVFQSLTVAWTPIQVGESKFKILGSVIRI